jgi:hypothetical protein
MLAQLSENHFDKGIYKMKKLVLLIACALLVSAPCSYAIDAVGSAFGALSTANTLGMGNGNFGLSVGLADATTFAGSFNYGLSTHTDGRIKLGLFDPDRGDTELALGADFKYQIVSMNDAGNGGPFDMAVGAFFEYFKYGYRVDLFDFSADVFMLGGQFIGSYPVKLESGTTLTPYGRFNVRLENVDGPVDSENELQFGFNGGVHWQVTANVGLFGEFQLDGNDGIFLGMELGAL